MRLSMAKLSEKYSKPGSLGHILPAVYFCSALKLRMVFPDEWIEKREHCLWTSVDYICACAHTPTPQQRSAILMGRTLWPKNCTQFSFGFCHYQVCRNLGSLLLHKSLLNTLEFISHKSEIIYLAFSDKVCWVLFWAVTQRNFEGEKKISSLSFFAWISISVFFLSVKPVWMWTNILWLVQCPEKTGISCEMWHNSVSCCLFENLRLQDKINLFPYLK